MPNENKGMRGKTCTPDEQGYYGWTNWETWNCYTTLTSFEFEYKKVIDKAGQFRNQNELAHWLKENFISRDIPAFNDQWDGVSALLDTLLKEAIQRINFQEVASHILDEALDINESLEE